MYHLLCCVQTCAVLGAIVGGDELEERKRSATETASRAVDGKWQQCFVRHELTITEMFAVYVDRGTFSSTLKDIFNVCHT